MAPDVSALSRDEILDAYRQLEQRVEQLRGNYDLQRRQIAAIGRLTTRSTQVAQLSKELNTIDIDEIARIAVGKIPHLFNARYCSIFLYDYENNALMLKSHNHPEPINERTSLLEQPNTLMGLAIGADQPLLIDNIEEFARRRSLELQRLKSDKYLTNSCIISPLMSGSGDGHRRVMGVLNLADRTDGQSFDRDDLNVAIQLSELIGTALSTSVLVSEMRSLAETDGLTRLANHRVFRESLDREVRRAVRYESAFSLLMADIDNFKNFNDEHGHLTGDHVLRQVSRVMRRSIRDGVDLAARYGGEEFAIILPETAEAGALVVADRLRRSVEESDSDFEGKKFHVTVSVGACEFRKGMTASSIIDSADRALYLAKRSGRNRLCFFDHASSAPRPAEVPQESKEP